MMVICIDQQGGKGNANYQIDVACTLLSDSHGTPHAVCIINNKADDNSNRDKFIQPMHDMGGVSKTLNSIRSDSDHVPCEIIIDKHGTNDIQRGDSRSSNTKD